MSFPHGVLTTGKDGKPIWLFAKGSSVVPSPNRKRYRATAVVLRTNKILLVRDKGLAEYSLPGGGFKQGESTLQAVSRELLEELLGISIVGLSRQRCWDLDGRRAHHKFALVVIEGEPIIRQTYELDDVKWWDGRSNLPVQGHVKYILSKLNKNA